MTLVPPDPQGSLAFRCVVQRDLISLGCPENCVSCFSIKLVPHSSLLLRSSHFELMDSLVDPSLLAEAKLRDNGLSAALRPALAEGG